MKHLKDRMLFSVLAILAFALIATQLLAVTTPAGTTLVVRTLDTISSRDRVGKKFTAQLDRDVVVNGTVLLRAGTKVFGKVESQRAHQAEPACIQPFRCSESQPVSPCRTHSQCNVVRLKRLGGKAA